ncbi:MAG TPA: TRAP transporter small permease [Brevibacterium sp.]|nr:TRAP transporter small permease [Brevibacterium sp.]
MLGTFHTLRRVTRALRMGSAAVILLVMLITGYDVVMRYVFAQPLEWSITISMVGLAAIVMLAVPDLEAEDGHIGMDLFYRGFGRKQTMVADVVTLVATFVFCTVSGIAATLTAVHFFSAGLRTAGTFNMPVWIGYALVALGLLLAAVMTLLRFILTQQGKLVKNGADDA